MRKLKKILDFLFKISIVVLLMVCFTYVSNSDYEDYKSSYSYYLEQNDLEDTQSNYILYLKSKNNN